jgi:hypothetical protein
LVTEEGRGAKRPPSSARIPPAVTASAPRPSLVKSRGAVYGQGERLHGESCAIPTKDENIQTLPLEIILAGLAEAGLVVSWHHDVADALADGHKPARIRVRAPEAVEDVHGAAYAREVGARSERLLRDRPGRRG